MYQVYFLTSNIPYSCMCVFVVFRQYNNPFKSTNYLYSDGLEIKKNITSLPDFPNLIQKCKGRFSRNVIV